MPDVLSLGLPHLPSPEHASWTVRASGSRDARLETVPLVRVQLESR